MLILNIYSVFVMAKLNLEKKLEWSERFMARALRIAMDTSCLKRGVGAVIVKDKRIIGSGYNGAAPGVESCVELGECLRKSEDIESGRDKDYCQALHAEVNAILNAGGRPGCLGNDMYSSTYPCTGCSKIIVGAGIKKVFYAGEYDREEHSLAKYTFNRGKVEVTHFSDESLEKVCNVYDELVRHIKNKNFRFLDKK